MQAAAILLAPDGTLIVEVPRLDAMLTDGTFDLIYHEHLSYFDLPPLQWLASLSDMKLTGVEKIDTHGGSFRLFFNHRYFTPKPSPRPSIQPINSHLLTPPGYTAADLDRFTRQAERTRDALRWSLRMAKGSFQPLARKVVGYTAPAKATVMANYAGLMAKNIAYIADDNPLKVGKYLPGTDIPIVASSTIDETHPDAVVVFAWNIAESLLPRLAGKTRAAIIPMPSVVEVYLGSKEEAPGEEGEAEDHPGEGQAAPHTDPAR
jgi:hypothetical protein